MSIVLAHPVSGHPHVEVPLVLVVTAVVTGLVAIAVTTRRPADDTPPAQDWFSWDGSLSPMQVVTRSAVLVLLLVAVVAGRVGVDDELENLAPALLLGTAWPLLVLGSVLAPVWRWVDPWDTAARALGGAERSEPPGHVWPAVAAALPLLWFLAVYPRPFDPRAVGLVVGGYTVVTVAGCLLLGRRRWLASSEPVGLTLTWLASAARGRAMVAPRGAPVLAGVVAGGLVFAAVRRTELLSPVARSPHALLYGSILFAAFCALGAALLLLPSIAARAATGRERLAGATLAGSLLALAGIALAVALDRNRLTTSLQLLPGLIGDPFGRGWTALDPQIPLDADPLGAAGLLWTQIAVIVAAHLWGGYRASRLLTPPRRVPVIAVLGYTAAAAIVAISLH